MGNRYETNKHFKARILDVYREVKVNGIMEVIMEAKRMKDTDSLPVLIT